MANSDTQLEQVVKQVKTKAGQNAQAELNQQTGLQWALQMAEIIGATKAIEHIATNLSAQTIHGLEAFQQAEGYKAYECETFVDFLEKFRPMGLTKDKYYERKALLGAEGDETFDLLNALRIPASKRKLLTTGDIEISHDTITVGDKSASINDPKAVKKLFAEVAQAFERSEDAAAKERKNLEKMMRRAGFTFEKGEDGKTKITPPDPQAPVILGRHDETDPANAAYMRVLSSLTELVRALNDLPSEEAEKRLNEMYRPAISQAVEMCFAFSVAAAPTRRPDDKRPETIGLTEADLADLMEDD